MASVKGGLIGGTWAPFPPTFGGPKVLAAAEVPGGARRPHRLEPAARWEERAVPATLPQGPEPPPALPVGPAGAGGHPISYHYRPRGPRTD